MNAQDYAEFDDGQIQQFEQDWMQGTPKALSSYLPAPTDSRFLGTLEELVHIDLEFRWKEFQKDASAQNTPPSIEQYIEKHAELENVKLGLIQGEFELTHRYGEGTSVQQYLDRFGDRVGEKELRPILSSLLITIKRAKVVKPGTTIDHYEIMNEHGRGGFGAVWRATDTKLGRRIAVKQLGQRLATNAESRRRFISEARVTAKLEHPGIVPVYDISNVDDAHAYYTMRLIQGRTMAQAIDFLHEMDPKSSEFELLRQRLLQSFVDSCQTIQYAHSQGVIHRDIKPHNIIVGDYGETIILDWGLASVIEVNTDPTESILLNSDPEILSKEESMETLRGNVLGTPAYMPPEQARGDFETISRRSDVYSLGTTLYHLITGVVPFTNGPLDELLERVKIGDIPAAHITNSNVEKPLSAIAARAMQVEPRDRYDSIGPLLHDVQKFMADQPVSAYRDPPLARAYRWVRKNPTTAASLAMIALFSFLAVIAGILVNNAWVAREEKRITDLQIAAERADATAISQIQSGRFEAAAKMLGQATEMIAGEPRLENFAAHLNARRDRTERIVDFYSYGMQAQEETFFDRVDRSAIYCQAALDRMGVLTNPDWWAHLPDEDLSPVQRDKLTSEIYRFIGLLASMRLAETAETAVQFEILLDPKKIDPDDPASKLFRASGFAASQGNRYRSARSMQFMEQAGEFAAGNRNAIDLTNVSPRNSIDAAIMGSILDNNTPPEGPERAAVSALLSFQNPNEVAREWLDSAVRDIPDIFWLPMFRGINMVRTGQPDEAIGYLSHAIGIQPNYWVGYQYRAWAYAIAAQKEGIPRRKKTALLNASNRDIQRAMDLEKDSSKLFWMQAYALSLGGASQDQITQAYLRALSLQPKLSELKRGHYSAITQMFYGYVQYFVDYHREQGNVNSQLLFLEAVGLHWQGRHDDALTACNDAIEKFADDADLKMLRGLIQLERGSGGGEAISAKTDDRFGWHIAMANATYYRGLGSPDQEREQLEAAGESARSLFQTTSSKLTLARNLIEGDRESDAIPLIRNAISLDLAVDLSELSDAAEQHGATDALAICRARLDAGAPFTGFIDGTSSIRKPAILNGGFELGLSYYWAPYASRTRSATWNNIGDSKTVTESTSLNPRTGDRCLELQLDCPAEDGSYGMMTQSIPVTEGATYEICFWARAEGLSGESIRVGIVDPKDLDSSNSLVVDSGSFDWQQYRLSVTATDAVLPLSIWARGTGRIWLDDFEIEITE